jgi:hypothetical protein
LEAHIGETGEMQHRPEAIASVREVVARDNRARSGIQTAKNDVESSSEDVRIVTDGPTSNLVRMSASAQLLSI